MSLRRTHLHLQGRRGIAPGVTDGRISSYDRGTEFYAGGANERMLVTTARFDFVTGIPPIVASETIKSEAQVHIRSAEEWRAALASGAGFINDAGVVVMPEGTTTTIRGQVTVPGAASQGTVRLVVQQPLGWHTWRSIPEAGPAGTGDAPVLLPVAESDYYYFARYKASGGRGYHAFHSTDMQSWRHIGPVAATGKGGAGWVTTAEYDNGKIYVYYDKPNDGDPHLIVGTIVNSGPESSITWQDHGMVFDDPSHGSDTAIIRSRDGTWHLISEDWSPINAREHSWDSPLASRVTSSDGITGFNEHMQAPPVDERTTPTGEIGTYIHPTSKNKPFEYTIHQPAQKAFGDWTAIQIGERFYLFADYHLAGGGKTDIKIGYFGSESMDHQFTFLGEFGKGHPDPSIGFAAGRFYLMIQRGKTDWMSDGPWQPGMRGRLGVDVDDDGTVEQWTDWQELTETYQRKPGFARVIDVNPAAVSAHGLPITNTYVFEIESTGPNLDSLSLIIDE